MSDQVDHKLLREVFLGACDLPAEERRAFLAERCAGNDALLVAVEKLLAKDHQDDDAFEVAAAAPQPVGIPNRIGAFRILSVLGEGGMGRVYKAEQIRPRRTVALKIMRFGAASDSMRQRFENEAEVLAKLQHAGIAQVFEFGTEEQLGQVLPFIAMEFVDGSSLLEHADRENLDVRARLELFALVCEAVAHAHQNGVIHRDLKPGNILVGSAGPKVLDFGISRIADAEHGIHTGTGQFVGTLGYMSPEQLRGGHVDLDVRSDVYSLGVVLFELLTGRPPLNLEHESVASAASIVQNAEPPLLGQIDPRLRGDVEVIAARCVEKEPVRRYVDAGELAADLRRHLRHEPILARPATTFYQVRKFAKRHRVAVVGAVAFVVAVAAGLVAAWVYAVRADELRVEAEHKGYRAAIAAASATIQDDPSRARRYLDSIDARFRGWEWRRLDAMFDSQRLLSGDAEVSSKNGRAHAVLLQDGIVVVRELRTGAELARFAAPDGARSPRLSPDGGYVSVIVPDEGKVVVLGVDGVEVCVLSLPDGAAEPRAIFGPAGKQLLVFGRKQPGSIYSLPGGRRICRLAAACPHLAFAPDGASVWGGRHELHVFDARTGELLRDVEGTAQWCAPTFSPDRELLACGSLRNSVIHDVTAGKVRRLLTGHRTLVGVVAFGDGSRYLASSGSERAGTTRIFDLLSGRVQRAYDVGGFRSLAWDDGGFVAAADADGVRLLSLRRDSRLQLEAHDSYLVDACFSPDGRMIASAGWDRQVLLWDAIDGRLLARLPQPDDFDFGLFFGVAFDARGHRVLALTPDHSHCFQWDVATGEQLAVLPGKEYFDLARPRSKSLSLGMHQVQSITTAPDLRVEGSRSRVMVTDHSGRQLAKIDLPNGAGAVALSKSGSRLAVASGPDVFLWQCGSGGSELRQLAKLSCACESIYSLAFDPDERRLAVGTNRSVVDIWDLASNNLVAELAGHSGYVHAVQFSPDGTRLVSGSGDTTVRVWDTVPAQERRRQAYELAELQRRELPKVVAALRGKAADAVAAAIRASNRNADERYAALRALLELRRR